ncbi:PREDICTED: uncharacterized protein LOC104826973 [Tarenaya hassleriana]|uniref:uncharacterized protein LOC104826973 n=1 Tax=Tarenaya hassleriana TaxID=28532 RepID=UPI00053CA866|nr:PREDICTED: uncharacterized protein LOC104826973 [Tarenaya hassleriana]
MMDEKKSVGSEEKQEKGETGPRDDDSPAQRDGEITEEMLLGQRQRKEGLIFGTPPRTPEDVREDFMRVNVSTASSPIAKKVNFSPMSSPKFGNLDVSPGPSPSRNRPNLKNLLPKLSFKNRATNSTLDIEKAATLSIGSASEGRDKSYVPRTWSLTNLLAPRLKKTESLPATPIAHSNPDSMHGSYALDPFAFMRRGSQVPIHRSRSVPAFNKDGSLRQLGFFRVIPTPSHGDEGNLRMRASSMTPGSATDENEDGGEDVPEEEAVCRICLIELGEDSEAFKMECMCKGELALAHKECTIKWFTIKGNRTCDVCKQEVQNLPVTLLRMQNTQGRFGVPDVEVSRYSVWQDVPILVIVSMLAYFCYLEQLLVMKMKSGAIAISLPFSCILGILASMTSTTMVTKKYVWVYATAQFCLVVIFAHLFYSLVHIQPVLSILLATLVGFGITMTSTTVLIEILKWRRSRVPEISAESWRSPSQTPPPPQTTTPTDQSLSGGHRPRETEARGAEPVPIC